MFSNQVETEFSHILGQLMTERLFLKFKDKLS